MILDATRLLQNLTHVTRPGAPEGPAWWRGLFGFRGSPAVVAPRVGVCYP